SGGAYLRGRGAARRRCVGKLRSNGGRSMLSGTTGTVTGRSLFGAAALLAATLSSAQPPPSYELALVDLDGRKEVLGHLPGTVFAPRVSPDGTRVAFDIQRPP